MSAPANAVRAAQDDEPDFKAQRDELLAALKRLVEHWDDEVGFWEGEQADIDDAKAVIARVEGSA